MRGDMCLFSDPCFHIKLRLARDGLTLAAFSPYKHMCQIKATVSACVLAHCIIVVCRHMN